MVGLERHVVVAGNAERGRVGQRLGKAHLSPRRHDAVLLGDDHGGGLIKAAAPRARVEAPELGAGLEQRDGVGLPDHVEHPVRVAGAGDSHDAVGHWLQHPWRRAASGSGRRSEHTEFGPFTSGVDPSVGRCHRHQPNAALRRPVRQQLCDRAAHRIADGDEPSHSELVEDVQRIGGTVLEAEGGSGPHTVAVAVMIDDDHAVLFGEGIDGVGPVGDAVDVPPVQQEQRGLVGVDSGVVHSHCAAPGHVHGDARG